MCGLTSEESSGVINITFSPTDYNQSVQEHRGTVCPSGVYNRQDDFGEVRNYPKKACQFVRDNLGDCSGIGVDPMFGYANGTPCVLIKMNRVRHLGEGGDLPYITSPLIYLVT